MCIGRMGTPRSQTPRLQTSVQRQPPPCAIRGTQKDNRYWHWHGDMGYRDGRSIPKFNDNWHRSVANSAWVVGHLFLVIALSRPQCGVETKTFRIPDNVHFEIDDFEDKEWSWREDYFDYIHSRFLAGSVSNSPELIRKAFKYDALS